VKLGIAPVAGGEVGWVNTEEYKPEDFLISGVGWWPDSSKAYFFAQNREQTWMDINTVPREGGTFTKLLRDQTEAWIEPQGGPWVLEDGTFLLISDRSGWRHMYRFAADGELMNPVTQGEWDVRGMEMINEDAGVVYVNGTKDSHIATNLYRVKLDGSDITRLTPEPGSHSVSLNPSGTRFIDSWSSRTQPTKVALYGTDGKKLRMLDTNPVYNIEEWVLGEQEQFQIETDDGFLLEAALVKPANFDPARKYPIWITTYAGPYAPTIRDSWGAGNTWDQMLANEGIVVMRVDPRPASGKGPQSAWTAYHQLGVKETEDLVAAVEWLEEQPWADTSRVGLSGHSYGGYITAYAMTHSDKFTAGIAGAPVTDWRDYDSIYTERYMGTPQSNPEGYAKSSAVAGARNLHGELLLVHGSIDDNVHPQNTIRMARALQDAGKPFEMMIYPGSRHGIGGRHYSQLQYDFIRRTMGVDGDDATPSPGDTPSEAETAGRRNGLERGRSGSTGAAPAGAEQP
jgi:dipeptidyl-peptidase-4